MEYSEWWRSKKYLNEIPNLDHFMYDMDFVSKVTASKLAHFFKHYDGVHTLLADRSEVGRHFIPDRTNTRDQPNVDRDYIPTHLYHNWRFNNVYQKKVEEKE